MATERPLVALDIETTGFDVASDRIIEIGAVKFRGGDLLGTFHSMVKPWRSIPAFITRLTGITEDMVRAAPNLHDALGALQSFVGDHPVAAHRARFEESFLWPHDCLVANEWIDTLTMARHIWPEAPSHALGELADWLGFRYVERHSALSDARAGAMVFLWAAGIRVELPELVRPPLLPPPAPVPPERPREGAGSMDYNVTLTVPASTAKANPAELRVGLTVGLIVEVRVGFPDGCADYVHVVITRGGHQVWPTNPDGDYAWNSYVHEIAASYALIDEPLSLKVVAWNGDARNAHTVTVGFNLLPLEPTILGRFVQTVLGRPSRW